MAGQNVEGKVEELRSIEANFQGILAHKQGFQVEMNEVDNALSELEDYNEEVYKIVSGMMIKTEKGKLVSELKEKKKILDAKIEAGEKQEEILSKRADELRKEIDKNLKGTKK